MNLTIRAILLTYVRLLSLLLTGIKYLMFFLRLKDIRAKASAKTAQEQKELGLIELVEGWWPLRGFNSLLVKGFKVVEHQTSILALFW